MQAQTALYNSGNIRIHETGKIGFHTNLINNTSFDENLGLVGFYGLAPIKVSGVFMPVFHHMEIVNSGGLYLDVAVCTTHQLDFILGDIVTPKNQQNIFFNFNQNAIYEGESNITKINGYATIVQKSNFIFPVGDSEQLRPLILSSNEKNSQAKCAYFFENPNNPFYFDTSFDTDKKVRNIALVCETEFWDLNGSIRSTISLSWNNRSNIASLTDNLNKITIVGWSKTAQQWIIIGATSITGDTSQGFVTSKSFIPNDFEAITFGVLKNRTEIISVGNFLVTPNGDGNNDTLLIPETKLSPNNSIQIYDRFGLKIFDKNNYTNEFSGFPNIDNLIISKNEGLPSGIYFYILSLEDLNLNFQGFLYLNR